MASFQNSGGPTVIQSEIRRVRSSKYDAEAVWLGFEDSRDPVATCRCCQNGASSDVGITWGKSKDKRGAVGLGRRLIGEDSKHYN